jgi:acyl carrier protein
MKLEQLVRQTFLLGDEVQITDDLGPGQVQGWDSLGHVRLLASLESTYEISVDMDDLVALQTVGDIRNLLRDKQVSEF